jgi:MSHA pilin protein MshD
MSTLERRAAGFTLPELILLIIVLSIGITGILIAYNQSVRGSGDPMVRKQVIAVAESMMEEIQLMPFSNPTGGFAGTCATATQANRAKFDDVGDYNCFPSAGGPPVTGITTIDGTVIPELAAYRVSVTITPNASLGTITAASGNAKLITVTVTGPASTVFVLDGYRTNYP